MQLLVCYHECKKEVKKIMKNIGIDIGKKKCVICQKLKMYSVSKFFAHDFTS